MSPMDTPPWPVGSAVCPLRAHRTLVRAGIPTCKGIVRLRPSPLVVTHLIWLDTGMNRYELTVLHRPSASTRVMVVMAASAVDALRVLVESIDTHGGNADDYQVESTRVLKESA